MKTISIGKDFKIESVIGTPVKLEPYEPAGFKGQIDLQVDDESNKAINELISSMKRVGTLEVRETSYKAALKAKILSIYDPLTARYVDWKIYYRSSRTHKIFFREI